MNTQAKQNVQNLTPYTAARDLYKTGIFLDANENYEQWVTIDWTKLTNLNRYPDSNSEEVSEALAKLYIGCVKKNNVFVGAGSDEIIDLLMRGFVEKDEYIMVMDPSYTVYEVQAAINNMKVKKIQLQSDFSLDIEQIRKTAQDVKIMFLCSPNNPTGNLISTEEVKEILSFYTGILVIDEAYIEFAGLDNSFQDLVNTYSQIVILRTFSKAWGLAGIRIGYAIASEVIVQTLLKIKDSYNVTSCSQQIALQALEQREKLTSKVTETSHLKILLTNALEKLGLLVLPTQANFILVKIPDATKIYKTLASKGMIVRDRSNVFLLENVLRVTVGSKKENDLLISMLKSIL